MKKLIEAVYDFKWGFLAIIVVGILFYWILDMDDFFSFLIGAITSFLFFITDKLRYEQLDGREFQRQTNSMIPKIFFFVILILTFLLGIYLYKF